MGIRSQSASHLTGLACMFGAIISLLFYGSLYLPNFLKLPALFLIGAFVGCVAMEGEFARAFWVYLGTSVLGFVLLGGFNGVGPYVLFCGWYPIVKLLLDESEDKIKARLIKLLLFNVMMAVSAVLSANPLFTPYVAHVPLWALLPAMQVCFWLYNGWIWLLVNLYGAYLRPRLE